MQKPRTSEQLARAWKAGRLDIDTALRRHLKLIGVWPVDPGFRMFLPILLGYARLFERENHRKVCLPLTPAISVWFDRDGSIEFLTNAALGQMNLPSMRLE